MTVKSGCRRGILPKKQVKEDSHADFKMCAQVHEKYEINLRETQFAVSHVSNNYWMYGQGNFFEFILYEQTVTQFSI